MAIANADPRNIFLAGISHLSPNQMTTDLASIEAIKPGYLVEGTDAGSGVNGWKKNSSDTEQVEMSVALNRPYLNVSFDTVIPLGEVMEVVHVRAGDKLLMWIPSGQTITNGELLQSAGTGLLITASATTAGANLAKFRAIDNPGAVTVETSIRVRVI